MATRPSSLSNDPVPEGAVVAPWQLGALFIGAAVVGAGLAIAVLPAFLPPLRASLTGDQPRGYWYLARTSGLVGYGLAWLSMVFGVLISNKLARLWPGGPTAFALHQHTSVLAVAFAAFHAVILLGDHYIGYTLPQILIPFTQPAYRPLETGLGQLAFYGLAVVTVTFYVRKQLGTRTWRLIHFASYAFFALALVHGFAAGTDTPEYWAWIYYWLTGSSILLLTAYRVLASMYKEPVTR